MELYTVHKSNGIPFILDEKCLLNDQGDYIGCKTGNTYFSESHKHSKKFKAKITHIDTLDNTGMVHLSEKSAIERKAKFKGCYVTVEKAHRMGDILVYRCMENGDYYSQSEIEIIE